MDGLAVIREACARLRRLPEPQWGQAPREPLGARAPHAAPTTSGATVEALARGIAQQLMALDAGVRGVAEFPIEVNRFALPDVIEALAKSVSSSADAEAAVALTVIAQQMKSIQG